jgi:hypothetical protein
MILRSRVLSLILGQNVQKGSESDSNGLIKYSHLQRHNVIGAHPDRDSGSACFGSLGDMRAVACPNILTTVSDGRK